MTTPAEVDALADKCDLCDTQDCVDFDVYIDAAKALREYAALLRARETVVTDEVVERAEKARRRHMLHRDDPSAIAIDGMRAALLAVLPLPSEAQPLARVRALIAAWRAVCEDESPEKTYSGAMAQVCADQLERAIGDTK